MRPNATATHTAKPSLKIPRRFTADTKPYDLVEWDLRTSKIVHTDGTVVFQMDNVEVPKAFSQVATDIMVSKYFRKGGVPIGPGTGAETSAKQVIERIVSAVAQSGDKQGGYFATPEDKDAFADELRALLVTQRAAFNSPVWFNCGLHEAYGITGDPAGNWAVDLDKDGTVALTVDGYSRPQVSACFIRDVKDDLMDLAEGIKTEMRLFKYGSGVGANFSKVRGKGELLSGGGTSSGVLSFLDIYDRAAGSIKSGGTTRRAAKMVVLDADHPDVMEFINWKALEEDKVVVLVKGGYDPDFNGEAYRTVSGQNANNSVRVTDEFMRAVESDGDWSTRFRGSGNIAKTYKAREIMRAIGKAAHRCADPGLQYHDICNMWNTVPKTGEIRATNPCGEFNFLDNTACNLASINLLKFLEPTGEFDVEGFRHACRILILAQDILVDHASYPTAEIAGRSHRLRPLGLGYANLGALLMRMGKPYDSAEGRAIAASITAIMGGTAWDMSGRIAATKGTFGEFIRNRPDMLRVGRMHADAVTSIHFDLIHEDLWTAARTAWNEAIDTGMRHGYRNSQLTLLAPTGTIGLLMDCDTTGVEPDFALVKHKKLAGGGFMQIINRSVLPALESLGYPREVALSIVAYVEEVGTVEGAPGMKDEHLGVFDCATISSDGDRFIKPMGHVDMMAAVQPFLCGSISKTVNMPETTTVEQIERVYIESWRKGLKCIALYRDKSKGCQVLNAVETATDGEIVDGFREAVRRRLPKRRAGHTQEASVAGHKVYLRTGNYENGDLGEVFINLHKQGAPLRAWADMFSIAVSLGLQYGVPLTEFIDAFTFSRFEPAGSVVGHAHIKTATSIVDYIFRALAVEYANRVDLAHVHPEKPDPLVQALPAPLNGGDRAVVEPVRVRVDNRAGGICTNCGSTTQRSGTCDTCPSCGTTSGCG
jgi:ribonucleoside-diphosphate reductase alpha chain